MRQCRRGQARRHAPPGLARRARMTALGGVAAAGLLLSACGTGSPSTTTTSSSSTSTSSTTTSTTTTIPLASAENLFISHRTLVAIIGAFAAYKHIPLSDIAGAEPGTIYYGYVPATSTYWARVSFVPASTAPLAVQVSFQDGGGDVIFSLRPGHAWTAVISVGVPFCSGLLHAPVPSSILAVWQLCQPGSTRPSTPQRCPTSQLSVTVGATQGALGTDLFPLVFKNTGTKSCLLQGFPGVSFEGPSGNQVATAAEREGTLDGPTISVAPGSTATAAALVLEGEGASCAHPETVDGFRVYPPNQYSSLFAASHLFICANAPTSTLQIYAFGVKPVL
jgi:hypothetical protein